MPTVQISNILRVADIPADTLPPGIIRYFTLPLRVFNDDRGNSEHIYRIHEWRDHIVDVLPERYAAWLDRLEALADKRNFSYFRIIDLYLYKSK